MRKFVLIALTVAVLPLSACSIPTEAVPPVQPASTAKAKTAKKKTPPAIQLTAKKTTFKPGPLTTGRNYTSVLVTVKNNGKKIIHVNPMYFAVTDSTGLKHQSDLGADTRGIHDAKLAPGERATGAVSFEGRFTPETLYFTNDLFRETVRAQVG